MSRQVLNFKNKKENTTDTQKEINQSFLDYLKLILDETKKNDKIEIRKVFSILSGKGYPALLVVLSLPFCIPVQIPGFSTPFGLSIAFIGLRIGFGKHLWWPKWILKKELSCKTVNLLIQKIIGIVTKVQKILHPRMLFLIRNQMFHRFHGILIFILGILLSLPLPIPMTNMLTALPIFCIGIGLLEDDGIMILISYSLALVSLTFFTLIFFGILHIHQIFN